MKPAPTVRSSRTLGRPEKGHRGAGYRPSWFGLLKVAPAPKTTQWLRVTDESQPHLEFEFEPILQLTELKGCFGLIRPVSSFHKLRMGNYPVVKSNKRRSGTQQLLVLSRASAEFSKQSQLNQRGLAKAVGRAYGQTTETSGAELLHLWIAVELAQAGMLDRGTLAKVAECLELPLPAKLPGCQKIGEMHVWGEFMERQVVALQQHIERLETRNPFLDRVSVSQTQRWLGIGLAPVAEQVLRQLARKRNLRILQGEVGCVALLPREGRTAPSAGAAGAFDDILARLARGEGAGRRGLHELYPSHINVVEQMFAAEHLFEAPDGYVFTRTELAVFAKELHKTHEDLAEVSVKDIKSRLGLKRRAAEGLRSFYTGLAPERDEPGEMSQAGSAE